MLKNLKYLKFKDLISFLQFIIILPIALICKIFLKDYWIITEDENEARDNGFWFFKYIRENHPKQKVLYAINKKSVDYKNVKDIGKIISYGGFSHWFWYIVSSKKISSQKGGKPNPAICYLFEVAFPIWKNKRYFLQHGITINDAEWLYYDKTRFKMFICGAKPEYDYVKKHFNYPEKNVKYLGFCRFDNLHNYKVDDSYILVMPTWREWLSRYQITKSNIEKSDNFTDSEYFQKWNSFLKNKELYKVLKETNKKLLFFPHRNMQKFLHFFDKNDLVEFGYWEDYNIQDVLKSAPLMITDYSSVFFDFGYMKKPVIFYQFDEEKFRKHQYRQGYFNYRNNPIGEWTEVEDELIIFLKKSIKENFPKNKNVKEFFTLYDDKNCERTYYAVKGDK